ncbi:nucleoside recognition domain-containing protein [Muricomes intestini]|jgi:spore maturation protein A|uniref:Spore maturation protein A n=1 Tax=Muricomes intestini TaxID=1796634 RepID=A0A4R3K487_9FIRM|nr:nucleoside recognition domain-containing protein [Muricomes intestini]TCS77579.1 spore maturation protein A [Muricomes intestini]HAX52113.1 nucleoside recognition protein [Lachnospiraceae bacterium]HCR83102.1 nucleoside recognition protein [Lachnospiraceae bacterium]
MLNYLWAGMIIVGVIFGAFNGKMPDVTNAALDSSKEAVSLCITMMGVMSFWVGIMEIATRAGIIQMASKKLRPLIRFLFPKIPEGHKANEYITTNFIANFLGLGWAATPAGLQGMSALAELEKERNRQGIRTVKQGTASNEMCTFLIMNISSLQLIPVNVIAYRSQYGSVNPAAIVGAGIVATAMSTIAAVVYCKIMDRRP